MQKTSDSYKKIQNGQRGVNCKFGRWTVHDTFIALQINFQVSCRNWLKIYILAFFKIATFQTLEIALNLKICVPSLFTNFQRCKSSSYVGVLQMGLNSLNDGAKRNRLPYMKIMTTFINQSCR